MREIRTERLVLKPMCREYLDSTHEYASDAENCRFMVFLPNNSIEETMGYLENAEKEFAKAAPSVYEMAIFCGGIHIGAVSLYMSEDRTEGEFGWTLNRKYHGKGYATEAAGGLMKFAVEELGIKRFIATCDTENEPSRRVMERLGMTLKEERGGRRNKLSPEERREYLYGIEL